MLAIRHWLSAIALLSLFFAGAAAAQATHSIYLDLDNDAATGCNVSTAAGAVSGAEVRLRAAVAGTPPRVVSVTRSACVGGAFGTGASQVANYAVGLDNGPGGSDVVELMTQMAGLGRGGPVRVIAVSETDNGADLVVGSGLVLDGSLTSPAPAMIPTTGLLAVLLLVGLVLWIARRHPGFGSSMALLLLLGAGAVWAANFIVDGQIGDWTGESPLATDPDNDATSGEDSIELINLYAAVETGRLFLRVDVVNAEVPPNATPVANDAAFALAENSAAGTAVGSVVATDADAMQTLGYAITAGNTGGAFAIDAASGAITVATPAALDFETTPVFSLTVTVTDNGTPPFSDTATVTVTLADVNEAPQLDDQAFAVLELAPNGTVVGTPAFVEPDAGQTQAWTITASNVPGAFAIAPTTGQITVLDSADLTLANNPITLTVQLSDNGVPVQSDSATITITVTDINIEPSFTIAADPAAVNEDAGAQTVPAFATAINDNDGGTQTPYLFTVTANSNAALFAAGPAIDGSGTLTYTPAPDANGAATVTVQMQDSGGLVGGGDDTSQPATFTITVNAVNDAPVFTAGPTQNVLQDAGAQVVADFATGIGPGGGADEAGQVLGFTVTNNTNPGLFSMAPAIAPDGTLTYTPTAGQVGSADITVTLGDDGGLANGGANTSAPQTFTINVNNVNDAPVFTVPASAPASLEDGGPQTVPAFATGIDDGDPPVTQTLTFNIVANSNPTLFALAPAIDPLSGDLTYTAAANANGSASITVTLSDDGGTDFGGADTSAPQSFTITVTAVNDAPGFVVGANQSVPQNSPTQTVAGFATAISPGPSDESGQSVSFTVGNDNPALFTIAPAITSDGTLTYTPAAGQIGVATVSVTLVDSGSNVAPDVNTSAVQTFTLTLTDINEAPVPTATPASPLTIAENSAIGTLVTTIAPNDPDPGQTHTYSIPSGNTGNAFAIDGAGNLTVAGALDFEGSNDPYTLVVRATDVGAPLPDGLFGDITIIVNLSDVNEAPVVVAGGVATFEEGDAPQLIDPALTVTDADAGATVASVTVQIAAGFEPVQDQLSISGGLPGIWSGSYNPATGEWLITALGARTPADAQALLRSILFHNTSSAPSTAPRTIVWSVNDGSLSSAPATSTVNLVAVNTAPVFSSALPTSATEDTPYTYAPTITDVDGPMQSWSLGVGHTCGGTVNPGNGQFTFTPAGPVPPAGCVVTLQVCDGGVPNECATQSDTVTITPVNDAPAITSIAPATATEDTPYAYPAAASDPDGVSLTWSLAPGNTCLGASIDAGTGAYAFTPAGPVPPASCAVGIQVCDGGTPDECTQQVTPITIVAVDDAPVAVADAATIAEDAGATSVDVLANDTDADGGPISIATVTSPANGVVVITGGGSGLTYQPNANYCNAPPGTAPDTFSYTLTPGGSSATVSVIVTCVDDAPVAVADIITITEDDPATAIPVLVNDTDVDGGPISITSVTQPANGTVMITGGGSGLTYLPDPNYCNTPPGTTLDTFTYTLTPGGSNAIVSVGVTCVVDPAVAVADIATVIEDAAATPIDVLGNDSNPDGSPLGIGAVTQPANGAVAITGGGTGLTYQPNTNYCNTPPGTTPDTFTYTISPGGSSGTVSVSVTCVDDAPTAVADSATLLEDAAATAITVLANDTDPDGGPQSVASVTQPGNGTVAITGGGSGLTYQPDPDYCNSPAGSPDTFTYTLTPGGSTAAVSVTVTCVNDPPTPPAVPNIPVHTHIAIGIVDGATGDLLIPGAITDPDSSNFVIGTAPASSVNGGELGINTATGSFTYNPPAGFTGTDSFQYTVCDDGVPQGCTPVTVSLVVSGPRIFFVDDDAVVVGTRDGTLQQPLQTLSAGAAAASATGDRIFVFSGSYTTGVTLANGVELAGHGLDATTVNDFDTELGISPPSHSIARPLVDQTPPVITNAAGNGITLGMNNTVRGVQIGNVAAAAISGTGFGTLTLYDDVRINSNAQAISLTNGTFAATSVIASLTSSGGASNVSLSNVAGSIDLGTGALSGASGTAFAMTGSTATVTYAGTINKTSAGLLIDVTNKASGAVTLSGAMGATAGTGISLNNLDGSFVASGVVTLNGGDAAIDVTSGSGGTISFSHPTSSITNPTNEAIVVNGSAPTFTFAGVVTKTNNAVSGIRVDGNTGGTIAFTGTRTLSTTSANAIQLNNNGAATTNFSGTTILTTTSGTAFNATGSGNVSVSGTGNTATSTTGRAINIDTHAITAAGVTFERVSSNGAPNGIRLSNTGSAGGLTVTGAGTANSGGTIQASTAAGISLSSTRAVSLTRMLISGGADDGINGANVTGFVCSFCALTNNGSTTLHEGMQFTELQGAVTIANSTFTNSAHNSIYVQNTGGTMSSLTINANNFASNGATTGNHHVLIEGVTGTPVFSSIAITGNTIANARSMGVQIAGNNNTSMPSVAVTGNTFTNNVLAVDASLVQGSSMTFNISNNTINSTVAGGSHALNSNQGIPSTGLVRGRIDNVQIGTAGLNGSGSMIGNGIRVIGNDNGSKQYIVTNTTIRETRLGRGIEVVNRNGTGRMDATVTSNNVNTDAQLADFPLAGIVVQSNCVPTCNSLRADVAANTVAVPPGGCVNDLLGTCLELVRGGASVCELLDRAPIGAASANAELVANNPASSSTSASATCTMTTTAPLLPP